MKRSGISIKWRIFAYFLLFAAMMLVLLWLFQTVFLDSFYKASKMGEIRACSNAISVNADNEEIQTLVERMAQRYEVCIRVISRDGRDVAQADILPGCIIHKLPMEELMRMFDKTQAAGGQWLDRFSREGFFNNRYNDDHYEGNVPPKDGGMMESIVYAQTTLIDGQPALILLNTTLSPVTATVQTLRRQLVYITVILVVMALGLAFIIGRRVYRPIVEINEAAKGLAYGKYHLDLRSGAYREIIQLNDTLNQAAEELGKVERLRNELIANISHDLRTPLTMITAYAEGMRDLPGENTPENVQVIIDEANRLTTLVNDVLDLSKLQGGAMSMDPQPYNLTSSVTDTLSRYQKLTEQKGYTLNFRHGEDAWVNADQVKIEQVLYNLINNAITYTGADKTVIVDQRIQDGWVTIRVTDTGEGVPEEDVPYIWDRYYKSSQAHRRAEVGTGLGLSIVRSILELHGARFGVESPPGKGASFWFALPLYQAS